MGKRSFDRLAEAGVSVQHRAYRGMQHSSCPEEMDDLATFFAKCLPAIAVSPVSRDEAAALPVKELKQRLQDMHVSTTGMSEKSELVEALMGAQAKL